jgi:hypothetical protein
VLLARLALKRKDIEAILLQRLDCCYTIKLRRDERDEHDDEWVWLVSKRAPPLVAIPSE